MRPFSSCENSIFFSVKYALNSYFNNNVAFAFSLEIVAFLGIEPIGV